MERMSDGKLTLDEAEANEKNWLYVSTKDITPQNLSVEKPSGRNKNNGGKNYGRNNNNRNRSNQKNRRR